MTIELSLELFCRLVKRDSHEVINSRVESFGPPKNIIMHVTDSQSYFGFVFLTPIYRTVLFFRALTVHVSVSTWVYLTFYGLYFRINNTIAEYSSIAYIRIPLTQKLQQVSILSLIGLELRAASKI